MAANGIPTNHVQAARVVEMNAIGIESTKKNTGARDIATP